MAGTEGEQSHLVEGARHGQSVKALYLHVPFCVSKCPYCDFNSHVGLEHLFEAYSAALCTEIGHWGEALGHPALDTVFIGGGTPSRVPGAHIAAAMDCVRASFSLAPGAEVTLEANPQSAEAAKLEAWLEAGVNRLSLGFQSLDAGALAFLERAHDAAEALSVFAQARRAGFTNINCDLIYAIPGLTDAGWEEVLTQVIGLRPDHVSAYELTPEAGTRLGADVAAGRTILPDEDHQLAQLDIAGRLLGAAGFERYEVSNWAQPSRECRHNLAYWTGAPYAAAGAGAHAHLIGSPYPAWLGPAPRGAVSARQWNLASPAAYVAAVRERGDARLGHEWLDLPTALGDHVMMGLRATAGIDLEVAGAVYGLDVRALLADRIEAQVSLGTVTWAGNRLRATELGMRVLNQVTLALRP